ncbi:MAG TPA: glutamate synthase subunit beta [Acidobacteriota bacterium]|jgi:glutamate synthase (NADPH/NADH) small chain|nr:glutamate synthase subunit beta [Acidobacteriota bacterium]HRV07827.1 glutamate synthase subunit beta [Acidobacteriota bacterium]
MGKPTGFLEYTREEVPEREPLERIRDWEEFHERPAENLLQRQGARCMNCGVPFCHGGEEVDTGKPAGCPIHNLIPEWNDLAYRGLWREAYLRLRKTNNFPEFTGRVCPAPCEAGCVLGIIEPPVTIKQIEWAVIERAWEEGWVRPEPPAVRTGKRVAVIGSGPAGLACAEEINGFGHHVTVFEKDRHVGGLLTYGIPNPKLDKRIVRRRTELMTQEGVEFRTGVEVGVDVTPETLLKEFDAVVLCVGAGRPRDLAVPGRELHGVHFAMEFLAQNTRRLLGEELGKDDVISARGQDVVVIGGGDTGTDCVATSLRQECKSLIQLEILPRPPDTRRPENPWPEWPRIFRVDYGHQEAIALFGRDPREFSVMTKEFLGDETGRVRRLRLTQVDWVNRKGRLQPREVPGTEREIPAQLVLLAMGFLGPDPRVTEAFGVDMDNRANIRAEPRSYATSVPKVFTAGDARRGQSLVVWAIREGREAAREVDRFLTGATDPV